MDNGPEQVSEPRGSETKTTAGDPWNTSPVPGSENAVAIFGVSGREDPEKFVNWDYSHFHSWADRDKSTPS